MAWIKALHITFLLIWCAGLLYLPGLFSEYAHANDRASRQRMRMITRYVFIVVASPAAVLAVITGSVLAYIGTIQGSWLPAKLIVVSLLVFFHLYCGAHVVQLERGENTQRRQFHLALLGLPVVLIGCILWLVLAKPDLLGWLS